MIKIGICGTPNYSKDHLQLEKELTVTLSDFSFFNNKEAIGKLEEKYSEKVKNVTTDNGIGVNKDRQSILENISNYRMRERPYAPEENKLLGQDIVIPYYTLTNELAISVLTKLSLVGDYSGTTDSIELDKVGFEKHGISGPISNEQMSKYSENIKSWLANGGSPGKEITEDDLYNIAIDGKLDDLTTVSSEKLALKSIAEQSTKCYETMSKMIDEILEDKKINCAG